MRAYIWPLVFAILCAITISYAGAVPGPPGGGGVPPPPGGTTGGSTTAGPPPPPPSSAQAPTPAIGPTGGTVSYGQTVTISDTQSGAAIYYTLDGSTPTSSSPVYSAPITVTASETISAIAIVSGDLNSAAASATFTVTAPAPTIAPSGGVVPYGQSVSLSDQLSGASIYYTLDGSTPVVVAGPPPPPPSYAVNQARPADEPATLPYLGPVTLTRGVTINAIAVATGFVQSPATSATFAVTPPPPTISPDGGPMRLGFADISIADASGGAAIYYTTDGSVPTANSTPYIGPIMLAAAETVNAIAIGAGNLVSDTASADFTVSLEHTFQSGLAMISVPADDSNYTLSQVLDQPDVKLAVWDPLTNDYSVTPTAPADTFRPGQGYWVRFATVTNLFDTNSEVRPEWAPNVSLAPGWNMIGCSSNGTIALSSMSIIEGNATQVSTGEAASDGVIGASLYTFQPGDTAYEIVSASDGTLLPFEGYWLYASQACTLSYTDMSSNDGVPPPPI